MTSPDADPEQLLTRLSTVSTVLQGLLGRLTIMGILSPFDIAEIELFALDLARGLEDRTASSSQVVGSRIEQDVQSFFSGFMPRDEA